MTGKPNNGADAPTPEELRERVEGTREELGQTIEELAAKVDVKARAREKGTNLLRSARDNTPEPVRVKGAQAATAAQRNRGLVFAGVAALALAFFLTRKAGGGR